MGLNSIDWPRKRARFSTVVLAVLLGLAVSACDVPRVRSPDMAATTTKQVPAAPAPLADPNRVVTLPEPLVAMGVAEKSDTEALVATLTTFKANAEKEDYAVLTRWADEHPNSVWRASVLTNLGLLFYDAGRFSKSIESWELAWKLGQSATDPRAQIMADRALGELMRMHARLGHTERLQSLSAEVEGGRYPSGATELFNSSKEALWLMENEPGTSFMCGPYALKTVALTVDASGKAFAAMRAVKSGRHGTTLQQLNDLAAKAGMDYHAVYRTGDAPLPLPAVVHWKVNHFAAVMEHRDGKYHIQDPTFGPNLWVTDDALRAESSGYFLIAKAAIDNNWRLAKPDEATKIYGMGNTQENDQDDWTDEDEKECCDPPQPGGLGLARYAVHSMLVSLNIKDTPLAYTPPKGPAMAFTLSYNQRDNRAGNPNFGNLGPKWTFNWTSYIQDSTTNPSADVKQFMSGGGWHPYVAFSPASNSYARSPRSHGRLVRTSSSPITYKLELPDGSVETFSQSDGGVGTRRIFLTERKDPSGNTITLVYDGSNRLTGVRDALNQTTTLTYAESDPLLISRITDPFGNIAQFGYASGRLASITDAVNLQSQFTYNGTVTNLISALVTPYGTTSFTSCDSAYNNDPDVNCGGISRAITVTDPEMQHERVQFTHDSDVLAGGPLPGVNGIDNPPPSMAGDTRVGLENYRNTFVWTKKAMVGTMKPSITSATVVHWVHNNDICAGGAASCNSPNVTDGIVESRKSPAQNRIWYAYANSQSNPIAAYPAGGSFDPIHAGTSDQPIKIGRRLNATGTEEQITQLRYNEYGRIIQRIEKIGSGRPDIETDYEYADNGIDLLKVTRPLAGQTDTLVDNFNTALDPAWVVTKFDLTGTVTTGTGNLVISTVGDFSNDRAASNPTGPYYDTGVMVCRKIPGAPVTIEVTQNLVATGTTTVAGLGLAPRVLMLRSGLDASSTDLQLFYRTDTTREVRLGGRFDIGKLMTTIGTGKFLPASPAALVPVRGRFEFGGTSATPSVSINGGAFQVLTAAKMPDIQWACLASNGLPTVAASPPPIESYTNFTMITPKYETLASYTYNAAHLPLTFTDALNKTTTFTYTAAGQLASVTDPLAHTFTWNYQASGTPDVPTGYLASTTNAANQTVQLYKYDARGRVKEVTQPATGQVIAITYDNLNRLLSLTYNDGTKDVLSYDKMDLQSRQDRLLGETRYAYNKMGQLKSVQDALAMVPNTTMTPCVSCIGFDNLIDPVNHLTTIVRDVESRPYDEASADRGHVVRAYDAAGRMATYTDALGVVATYTYDALNRVKTITYPAPNNTENLTFTYDTAAGCTNGIARLCSVVDAAGTTVFNYDRNGRVLGETRTESGITPAFVTSYQYDFAGQLVSMSLPTGKTASITPDVAGRLQTLSVPVNGTAVDVLSAVGYNANDQLTAQTFGNGLSEARAYNNDNRLWKIDLTDPLDTDLDGMPDAWENLYPGLLNPNDPSDADLDPDSDGLTNVQEYNLGTKPNNADSDGDGTLDGVDNLPLMNYGWMVPVIRQITQ